MKPKPVNTQSHFVFEVLSAILLWDIIDDPEYTANWQMFITCLKQGYSVLAICIAQTLSFFLHTS